LTTEAVDYSKVDNNSTPNQYADFWRRHIGVNVIPSKVFTEIKLDGKGNKLTVKKRKPIVPWKDYQTVPIPEWKHEEWKRDNKFKDGMSIICGKVWHRSDLMDYNLVGFDGDNLIAKQEFLLLFGTINGQIPTVEQFAQQTLVEQHLDNEDKLH
jgi:hypothetical protein